MEFRIIVCCFFGQLHVAALQCMKGESAKVSARLCRVNAERDALEKQLGKLQVSEAFQLSTLGCSHVYIFYNK